MSAPQQSLALFGSASDAFPRLFGATLPNLSLDTSISAHRERDRAQLELGADYKRCAPPAVWTFRDICRAQHRDRHLIFSLFFGSLVCPGPKYAVLNDERITPEEPAAGIVSI